MHIPPTCAQSRTGTRTPGWGSESHHGCSSCYVKWPRWSGADTELKRDVAVLLSEWQQLHRGGRLQRHQQRVLPGKETQKWHFMFLNQLGRKWVNLLWPVASVPPGSSSQPGESCYPHKTPLFWEDVVCRILETSLSRRGERGGGYPGMRI